MKRLPPPVTKLFDFIAWKALAVTTRVPRPVVLHKRKVRTGRTGDEVVWRTTSPAIIEPRWGYLIVEPRLLSLKGLEARRGSLPPWTYAIPSARRWLSRRDRRARQVVELDRVVSLRYFFEWNYYHFFFDVLGKLALLDQLGLRADLPVIVGSSAAELRFTRELMELGGFADINWFVQPPHVHVRAREVTFCQSRVSGAHLARYILERLELEPVPEADAKRRVLLVRRSAKSGRRIVNLEDVEALTTSAGFETIDTSDWPLREQIELFRRTRTLIAIHGAGMTNMIFRAGRPMSVVELCSESWHPDLFKGAAEQLGFDFARLTFPAEPGSDGLHADFVVDLELLAATLRQLDT
ncbi:MAG: glycosyltransferase family 61 protein [Ilumatobacteraceae bacterium]